MNQNPIERKYAFLTDGADQEKQNDDEDWSDDISEDAALTHVDRMADEIQG